MAQSFRPFAVPLLAAPSTLNPTASLEPSSPATVLSLLPLAVDLPYHRLVAGPLCPPLAVDLSHHPLVVDRFLLPLAPAVHPLFRLLDPRHLDLGVALSLELSLRRRFPSTLLESPYLHQGSVNHLARATWQNLHHISPAKTTTLLRTAARVSISLAHSSLRETFSTVD